MRYKWDAPQCRAQSDGNTHKTALEQHGIRTEPADQHQALQRAEHDIQQIPQVVQIGSDIQQALQPRFAMIATEFAGKNGVDFINIRVAVGDVRKLAVALAYVNDLAVGIGLLQLMGDG